MSASITCDLEEIRRGCQSNRHADVEYRLPLLELRNVTSGIMERSQSVQRIETGISANEAGVLSSSGSSNSFGLNLCTFKRLSNESYTEYLVEHIGLQSSLYRISR
jgi:hypothetical protein